MVYDLLCCSQPPGGNEAEPEATKPQSQWPWKGFAMLCLICGGNYYPFSMCYIISGMLGCGKAVFKVRVCPLFTAILIVYRLTVSLLCSIQSLCVCTSFLSMYVSSSLIKSISIETDWVAHWNASLSSHTTPLSAASFLFAPSHCWLQCRGQRLLLQPSGQLWW